MQGLEEKTYNQLLFKDNNPKSDDTTDAAKQMTWWLHPSSVATVCMFCWEKCWLPCPTDGLTGFYGPPNLMHDMTLSCLTNVKIWCWVNDKPNYAVLTSCSCRHVFSVWPEKLRLTVGCSRGLYLCTGASRACQVNWVESGDKIWLEDFCLSRILNKQRCSKSDVGCEFIDMTVAACLSVCLRENITLPYLL